MDSVVPPNDNFSAHAEDGLRTRVEQGDQLEDDHHSLEEQHQGPEVKR